MTKPSTDLLALVAIAIQAGEEIMMIYSRGFKASYKPDNSPVTEADVRAEEIILAGLQEFDPQTPVIAEEAVAAGKKPEAAPRFYLVDPLDGTKEFLHRNGEFTVNIGLIEKGDPVAGVVYAPAVGRLFCGDLKGGAFEAPMKPGDKLDEAKWSKMAIEKASTNELKAVASRSHRDEATENWLAAKGVKEVISAGSSLKFCLVASGQAHLYPRFGRTMEWDTAAGHAVVVAAGGKVVTSNGQPLRYGKQERGFDNPAFFVSA